MKYYSFINILFIDDYFRDEIQDVIKNKLISSLPLNIYGIDKLTKEDVKDGFQCFEYDRTSKKFKSNASETIFKITDFSLLFIDYQLENSLTGSDIKNYLYKIETELRPKLVLLSRFKKESLHILDASMENLGSIEFFDGFLEKSNNYHQFYYNIYKAIKKLKIKEFISFKFDKINSNENNEYKFDQIFEKNPKLVSRLWISEENEEVAYIYDDNGVRFFSDKDFDFFQKNTEIIKVEALETLGIPTLLSSKYDLGGFSHKYVGDLIERLSTNDNKKPTQNICISSHLSDEKEKKILTEKLFEEKSVVIQFSDNYIQKDNLISEIQLLIKRPSIDQQSLYYEDKIETGLLKILNNESYVNKISKIEISNSILTSNNFELYTFKLIATADEKLNIPKVIENIYFYAKSIVRPGLDQAKSIFDLIGPSMVGPSSSHTCGANRIGRVSRSIISHTLKNVDTSEKNILISARLHDSFRKTGEGHKTLNAFAAGLLKDIKKDDDGSKGTMNVAKFSFKKVDLPKQDFGIPATWLGYNNYNTAINTKFDIPLPVNFPKIKEGKKEGKNDIHENAVAVIIKLVNNKNEELPNFNENWKQMDLIIIGESIGGGKIQIKAIGGNLINSNYDLLKEKWKFIDDNNNSYFFYDSKFNDKEIPPLNGMTNREYPDIENIETYPPTINFKKGKDRLSYAGLDDLKNKLKKNISLLDAAYEYEFWHLTGWNKSLLTYNEDEDERKGIEALFTELKTKIYTEVENMLNVMVESQEKISGDLLNEAKSEKKGIYEFTHLIDDYRTLQEQEVDFQTFSEAASLGAITAMTKNALSMKILAAPTGGASGVIPGTYKGLEFYLKKEGIINDSIKKEKKEECIESLLIAGFLSAISSNWVTPSGAELGCQAETGTGAAMGAAFACKLLGGNDEQIINSFSLALKNSMGLTCDPVAGRVNTPCIKRNGFKAVDAINAAFLSLKNVTSIISSDEILIAMKETGEDMQSKYRETSEGGLAKTTTGIHEKLIRKTPSLCQN